MINKENLDKRICEVEEKATNEQTYREYIKEGEEEFFGNHEDLDSFTDEQLVKYLDFIDNLWMK